MSDYFLNSQRQVIRGVVLLVSMSLVSVLILDVDVVTTATGTVVPGVTVPVAQLGEGGVLKTLYAKEGATVKKGDVLLELDSQLIEEDLVATSEKIKQLNAQISRIEHEQFLAITPNSLISAEIAQKLPSYQVQELINRVSAYRANVAAAQLEISLQQTKVQGDTAVAEQYHLSETKAAQLQKRYQHLLKEGFISEAALEDKAISTSNLAAQYKEKLAASKQSSVQLSLAVSNLVRIKQEYLKSLSSERTAALNELAEVNAHYHKLQTQLASRILRAPVAGTVSGLQVVSAKQVLSAGTTVAEIIPSNTAFTFEGWLRNEDLSKITKDTPAKVKLSAYPFQKYGWLDAKITWISLNSETPPEMRNTSNPYKFYKVRATLLPSPHFKVKEPLRAGLEAQLDIYQGTRTVFEYLVYPLIGITSNAFREK